MRDEFYQKKTANFPRLKTDALFADYENEYKYSGFVGDAFSFVLDKQLMCPDLWKRFVQQFREDSDYDAGWRGEFWGKMMRGACFVYSYIKSPELYKVILCMDSQARIQWKRVRLLSHHSQKTKKKS